jgi:hypothetical protein
MKKLSLLIILFIVFAIARPIYSQEIIVKVNPISCVTCLGGLGNFIDSTTGKILLIFPESMNPDDAQYYIDKMININANEIEYIISDSSYRIYSRNLDSEIYFYDSTGSEIYYGQISEINRHNNFFYTQDSISNNCDQRYLFVNQIVFIDSLAILSERRYGFVQFIDLQKKNCISTIQTDSISIDKLYDSLNIGSEYKQRLVEYNELLKSFNKENVEISSIFNIGKKIYSIAAVPYIKIDTAGALRIGSKNIIIKWKMNEIDRVYPISFLNFPRFSLLSTFSYNKDNYIVVPLITNSLDSLFLGSLSFHNDTFQLEKVNYFQLIQKNEGGALVIPFQSNNFLFSNNEKSVYLTKMNENLSIYNYLSKVFDADDIFIQDIKFYKNEFHIIYEIDNDIYYCSLKYSNNKYFLKQNILLNVCCKLKSRAVFSNNLDILYLCNTNTIKLFVKKPFPISSCLQK